MRKAKGTGTTVQSHRDWLRLTERRGSVHSRGTWDSRATAGPQTTIRRDSRSAAQERTRKADRARPALIPGAAHRKLHLRGPLARVQRGKGSSSSRNQGKSAVTEMKARSRHPGSAKRKTEQRGPWAAGLQDKQREPSVLMDLGGSQGGMATRENAAQTPSCP